MLGGPSNLLTLTQWRGQQLGIWKDFLDFDPISSAVSIGQIFLWSGVRKHQRQAILHRCILSVQVPWCETRVHSSILFYSTARISFLFPFFKFETSKTATTPCLLVNLELVERLLVLFFSRMFVFCRTAPDAQSQSAWTSDSFSSWLLLLLSFPFFLSDH